MEKTICKEYEVNYVCNNCGQRIINAVEKKINCPKCGRRLTVLHPLNSREEQDWE